MKKFCYNSLVKIDAVQTLKNPEIFPTLVWDYSLTPQQFADMLTSTDPKQQRQKLWALTRVFEHANFYLMKKLISKADFVKFWPEVRTRIFNKDQVKAYDYLAKKYAV